MVSRERENVEFEPVVLQAEGLLMVSRQLSPDEAFQLLVDEAMRRRCSVHDIARAVVDGELGLGG
jgi:AmiR/NasT family two-component response regulator